MTTDQIEDGDEAITKPRPKQGAVPDIFVRPVEPEDAPGVTALMNLPGYRWGTMRLPYQSVSTTRQKMSTSGPNFVCLVATSKEEIVGMASLTRFEGRRSHVGAVGMGVHDSYVGHGLGTRLLTSLLEVADDWWALRRIELTVNTDNARAIGLYERMGFEREGVLRDYALRGGEFIDAVSMARLAKLPQSGKSSET
ncbi:GNAT family N-acetyltransferase [Cognatiyoonia sp. IB215446]|uniref:GNAT family N-acetyltransferase n=1 Tax=Cognatiyoonia sp. IB215446 TaxID=3097355 RepID=UPI002A0CF21B|nr:GNAT family N-acetyltransferase [Cognatiyoonia sp. IB215446]MDX8346950.1 GNAT family N-acetyltransferase [Cognatiyoonia sp. IB215446]